MVTTIYIQVCLFLALICWAGADELQAIKDDVASVRVESCRGCSLNRLPEVKAFIFEDIPQYDNVEFLHISGAKPILIPLNKDGEELTRVQLSSMTRQGCNEVLEKLGFYKRGSEGRGDGEQEDTDDRDEL